MCAGANCIVTTQNSQAKSEPEYTQNAETVQRDTPASTNPANMMHATKVDGEPPQVRIAAIIAKRARCIPLR